MIDLSELHLHFGKWDLLLDRVRRDKRVTKAEVLELLRNDEPLTGDAKLFVADVIEGNHSFQRGNTDWYPKDIVRRPRFVVSLVRAMERYIKDPDNLPESFDDETRHFYRELHRRSKLKRSRQKITPNQKAVAMAAESLEITERHVRTMIKEVNRQIEAFRDKHGCTKDEAERFLLGL